MKKSLPYLSIIALILSSSVVLASGESANCKTLWDHVSAAGKIVQSCFTSHHLKDCSISDADFCACVHHNEQAMKQDCRMELENFHQAIKDAHRCALHPMCSNS